LLCHTFTSAYPTHFIWNSGINFFGVPIFTQKGKLNHVKFGRYYANSMYTVAGTGALMALTIPLVIRAGMI
jgi:hypothetical protein